MTNSSPVGAPPPFHLYTDTDPMSGTFLFRIQDNGQRPETSNPRYSTHLGERVPEAQRGKCIPSMSLTLLASPTLSYANYSNGTTLIAMLHEYL